jgi:hypothetical protein
VRYFLGRRIASGGFMAVAPPQHKTHPAANLQTLDIPTSPCILSVKHTNAWLKNVQ